MAFGIKKWSGLLSAVFFFLLNENILELVFSTQKLTTYNTYQEFNKYIIATLFIKKNNKRKAKPSLILSCVWNIYKTFLQHIKNHP